MYWGNVLGRKGSVRLGQEKGAGARDGLQPGAGSSGTGLTAPHLRAQQSRRSGSPPLSTLIFRVDVTCLARPAEACQQQRSGYGGSGMDTNLNPTAPLSHLSCCPLIVDLGLLGSGPHWGLKFLCLLASSRLCQVSLTQSMIIRTSYKKPGLEKPGTV